MQPVNLILVLFACTALVGAAAELRWPPENFPKNRAEFGDASRLDGDGSEIVEPLGRIVKLKTLFDPTDINSLNTKFTIHTRAGSSNLVAFIPNGFVYSSFTDERFHYNLTTLATSGFDIRRRTVVIISGFMTNDRVEWMDRVKDRWLELADCNVIIVTWKEGNRYVYSRAAATTPRVARQITIFLHYLASLYSPSTAGADVESFASRVHFVGHSLGCHIAGFVGQDLGGKLGRITALDPAGPSFDQFGREHRLDPTDARLVEAIHTNSGKMSYASFLKSGAKNARDKLYSLFGLSEEARSIAETFSGEGDSVWFGIEMPVGHLDYYANNGKVQPGCKGAAHICDHGRSHHIYEGILGHELELRQRPGENFEQWRTENRLVAVAAEDFASFASGQALNQRCPALLHDRNRLSGLAGQQMAACTVPLDQLGEVEQRRAELEQVYGISFSDADALLAAGQRYYLKTLAEKPFVGDHYLLRAKLDRSSVWDKNCALQVEASFANNRSTTIELDKELRVFGNGQFFGVTLPFVNPNGAQTRLALDKVLHEYTQENQNQNQNQSKHDQKGEAAKLIEQILPSHLALKIIESKLSAISKWMSKSSSLETKCALNIDSIQVHPLAGFKRSLFGLYTSQQPGDAASTTMMSHLEYKTHKQTKKVWPESLVAEHANHERRLEMVVIG